MLMNGCECVLGQKVGLEIAQPEALAEAVACDRFNAAQLTVRVGIVNGSIH